MPEKILKRTATFNVLSDGYRTPRLSLLVKDASDNIVFHYKNGELEVFLLRSRVEVTKVEVTKTDSRSELLSTRTAFVIEKLEEPEKDAYIAENIKRLEKLAALDALLDSETLLSSAKSGFLAPLLGVEVVRIHWDTQRKLEDKVIVN
ncbi:hypothetical protein IIB49_02970, partial [Patescibacteria group bacterium]|nr:hypothetical protein [Patescibacteria group bacterium]